MAKFPFPIQHEKYKQWLDLLEIGEQCHEKFVEWGKVPELKSLDISLAGLSSLEGHYIVARTAPSFHIVIFGVTGSIKIHTPHGTVDVQPLQYIFLPAGQPYIMELTEPLWQMVWFHIEDTAQWQHVTPDKAKVEYCDSAKQLYHVLSLIFYETDAIKRRPALKQLSQYLNETLTVKKSNRGETLRLEQLVQDLETSLHVNWSVNDMANKTRYSAPHLHRLFVKHYQCSPIQFLIKLRMERAQYLLQHTNWSLEQIAEQVGYSDVFNFSKRFKKSVGLSPGKYRTSQELTN